MLSIRLILLLLNIKIILSCMHTSSSSSPTATDTSTTTSTASSATTSTSTTTTTALTTTTTPTTTSTTTTTTTTTTTPDCTSCTAGQITLLAGTPTPTAGAVTFDANGCAHLAVTCTMIGSQILIELNMGANGTDGPTQDTITLTVDCSAGGIWTFMGTNIAITSLDCVSAVG